MSPRESTDVDRWNRVVREAALAPPPPPYVKQSDEEIERQLLEAGFDLDEVDARADATYEAALAKFGPTLGTPTPDERPAPKLDSKGK